MKIYTVQLSKHRLAKSRGVPLLNTTAKNGHKAFAPTWPMVIQYKNNLIDATTYTLEYDQLMKESQKLNPEAWEHLLNYDKIALSCMCRPLTFCHRHLLADIVAQYVRAQGIEVELCGEIR